MTMMWRKPLSTTAAAFVCSRLNKKTFGITVQSSFSSATSSTGIVISSSKNSIQHYHVGLPKAAAAATTAARRSMMSTLPSSLSFDDDMNVQERSSSNKSCWPRFEDKDNLHVQSKLALAKMGLVTMTEIQAKTFDAAVSGRDVLARSRTGTGKTIAFLLPAIERILQQNNNNNDNNTANAGIQMLILCPTRELAIQIGEQTKQLTTTTFESQISHQVMFGGSSRNVDINRMKKCIPTIVIATPGRIQDHLDNTILKQHHQHQGNSKSFASLFQHTHLLVLDEMDRLLDMGFRMAVEKIVSHLPKKEHRQTLLFSATLPTDVKQVIHRNLKSNFVTVDCIHDADPTTHTNALVHQSHVIANRHELVEATVKVLLNILETQPQAKMICFFPTTKMVTFYAELFNEGMGRNVLELHSGKSQSYRTSVSNKFRQVIGGAVGSILFTSDVSARGVDYQDVTHVVQVGMADSRETYLHRLGRTARAGKKGLGIVILSDLEARGYLKTLKGLDVLQVNTEMQNIVDGAPSTTIVQQLHPVLHSIRTGKNPSLEQSAQASYRGMLGYYRGQLTRIGISSSEQLVEFANSYSKQTGLVEVPTLLAKTARVMGLYGVRGIVCDDDGKRKDQSRRGTSTTSLRSSSSFGNQNMWPRKDLDNFKRTTSRTAPEGERWTSTFRNGNATSRRLSTSSQAVGIQRSTSGNAPERDDQQWTSSSKNFRNGGSSAIPPPPPTRNQSIMGKSEKWNRRRGKSEWVNRENNVGGTYAWKNSNESNNEGVFQRPSSLRTTTSSSNQRRTTPV